MTRWAFLVATAATLAGAEASAAVMMSIRERVGEGVRISATGSLDLAGLGTPNQLSLEGDIAVNPSEPYIVAGIANLVDSYDDVFVGAIEPIGPGSLAPWWSYAGGVGASFFAVTGSRRGILLPPGYESGEFFEGGFVSYVGDPGFSLQSLGITEGDYRYDLVNGENVTVKVCKTPASQPDLGL